MSASDHRAIIMRYAEEVFNKGDLGAVETYIDAGYLRHDPGLPFTVQGPEGIKQMVAAYRAAFPDIHLEPVSVVADGGTVAAHWSVTGTHQGDLMGIPPTGKAIQIPAIEIFAFAGDKIVEQWVVVDNTAMMQQLGVGG